MPNPHTFHPPRDQRSGARQFHTGGSNNTVPDATATTGPVSAREAYIAHRLGTLTNAHNPTGGGTQRHDTDPGGGLHTGGLDDHPERVGGYSAMNPGDGQAFRNQYGDEFDQLHPDDQTPWQKQADAMTAARGNQGNVPAPRTNASHSFPGANMPLPSPGAPAAKSALPGDTGVTDPNGDQHIATAGGGSVDIPARKSQDGPDNDPAFAPTNGSRTGIYQDGVEQVKQADGTFVPARGPGLAATAGPVTASNPLQQSGAPANPLLAPASTPGVGGQPDALTASMGASLGSGSPFPSGGTPFPGAGMPPPAATVASQPATAGPVAPPQAPSATPTGPASPPQVAPSSGTPPVLSLGSAAGNPAKTDSMTAALLKPPGGPAVQVNGKPTAFPGKLSMQNPEDDEDEEQGSAHAFPGMGRKAVMA